MRILRNYIISEMIGPLVLSLGILTLVLVMGNFIKLADLVINRGVELIDIGKLFLLLMPRLLSFTLPMAALMSTLITFGRLSNDNEIIAMRANGINIFRIALPVMTIGLLLSLIALHLNDKVVPRAHYSARMLTKEMGLRKPTAYFEAGTFIRAFKDYIIFVHKIEGNRVEHLRIYQPQPDGPTRAIIAREGEVIPLPEKNSIRLKLIDGTSEEPNPMNPKQFYKLNFKTYYITLVQDTEINSEKGKKTKEMTFSELLEECRRLDEQGIDTLPHIKKIHTSIASSFACFAFILIAIPLAITAHRSEKSIGVGISLALMVIYWLMMAGGQALNTQGILPIWLSAWLADIILISFGAVMLWRTVRY